MGRVLEKLKLAGEQCYQSGQFQLGKNWWKMPKLKNPNETFCMIFKQFVFGPKWFLGAIYTYRKNETMAWWNLKCIHISLTTCKVW